MLLLREWPVSPSSPLSLQQHFRQAIADYLQTAAYPLVLLVSGDAIADNSIYAWSRILFSLPLTTMTLRPVAATKMQKALRRICPPKGKGKGNIQPSSHLLSSIVQHSHGDMRQAVIQLQWQLQTETGLRDQPSEGEDSSSAVPGNQGPSVSSQPLFQHLAACLYGSSSSGSMKKKTKKTTATTSPDPDPDREWEGPPRWWDAIGTGRAVAPDVLLAALTTTLPTVLPLPLDYAADPHGTDQDMTLLRLHGCLHHMSTSLWSEAQLAITHPLLQHAPRQQWVFRACHAWCCQKEDARPLRRPTLGEGPLLSSGQERRALDFKPTSLLPQWLQALNASSASSSSPSSSTTVPLHQQQQQLTIMGGRRPSPISPCNWLRYSAAASITEDLAFCDAMGLSLWEIIEQWKSDEDDAALMQQLDAGFTLDDIEDD